MTADEQTRRETGSTRSDQIGKVFLVVGRDVRKCLICEGTFTRHGAAEHAKVACMSDTTPETGSNANCHRGAASDDGTCAGGKAYALIDGKAESGRPQRGISV